MPNGERVIVRSSPPLKGGRRTNRNLDSAAAPRRREAPPSGEGWLWGAHAVLAALANPLRRVELLLVTRNAAARLPEGVAHTPAEPADIERRLPPGAVHQGFALKAAPLPELGWEDIALPLDARPLLVLDQVTDPQNVGAAFRSAAAFGARGLILQDRNAPPITGALAKAAVGAVEIVPEARVVNIARTLDSLQEAGYLTIGLAGEAQSALAEAVEDHRPVALVVGAEDKGVRPLVARSCERLARIPIAPAMESLNAGVAAAIALYECSRQRRRQG